jgi:hypothetical protein
MFGEEEYAFGQNVVCPSKSMKTTLPSVYFGVGSEMANETNPSLAVLCIVDIDAGKVDSMKKMMPC